VVEHTAPGVEGKEGHEVYLSLKNGPFQVKLATEKFSLISCPITVALFYEDKQREVRESSSFVLLQRRISFCCCFLYDFCVFVFLRNFVVLLFVDKNFRFKLFAFKNQIEN
jgi:hypothetical protein